MGKQVEMVCTEGVPGVYHFLDGSELVKTEINLDGLQPEVIICLDCAEKERVALPYAIWGTKGYTVVNIDHHITNSGFGDLNIIESGAAATGEVVYSFLVESGSVLDHSIATALYTAIATDTGFFRFANTSAFTLETVAFLVKKYGVEPARVAEMVHEQKSFNSICLLGEVLSTLKIGIHHKVAWLVLNQAMLARFPVENEETESYVNYARSIEGVEIGLLFKELHPNEIKVSWRSSSMVDVSKLAAHFGGGGHARAAGCNINGPEYEVVRQVLDLIDSYYGAN
jgi:phosphoesterase RecJ-like protein